MIIASASLEILPFDKAPACIQLPNVLPFYAVFETQQVIFNFYQLWSSCNRNLHMTTPLKLPNKRLQKERLYSSAMQQRRALTA